MTDKPEEKPTEPILSVTLNMDKVRESIPDCTSEKLCEMIVCDRYFGFGEKVSPICMEELSRRRMAGDAFDFESYIDQAHKKLPVINLTQNVDLQKNLKQAMAAVKGKIKQ
jgi:hypothetical protein